jgi:Zn-dependent peptidase ImmA (M78 family)
MRDDRRAWVARVVEDKRRQHPELAAHVITIDGVLRVLEREGIELRWCRQELRSRLKGRARAYLGRAVIFLNPELAGDELIAVALHELGHCHLHLFDPRARSGKRSEREADLYAAVVLRASELRQTA